MSFKKYKRLCLVLFFPLLLLGVLAYIVFWPYPMAIGIFCDLERGGYCRSVGEIDGAAYKIAESLNPSYGQMIIVKEGMSKSLFVINITPILISKALVLNADVLTDGDGYAVERMQELKGMAVPIIFGSVGKKHSGHGLLYCNDLSFESAPRNYKLICYGEKWSSRITFAVDEGSLDLYVLDNLKDSILKSIDSADNEKALYFLLAIPVFIYLFIFLSLVYWFGVKAVRYVNKV